MSDRLRLILDVDTGTDDALALAYAVSHPDIELVAVTTVAGNIGVGQTTANTVAVLDWLGAVDVPVHRGASRPLARPHRDAIYFHHEGGLGGARLQPSARPMGRDRGPAAIIRLSFEYPGELTLVCAGPLTNLAIALNVEPSLVDRLAGVVVMGGAYSVPGNTTPSSEFNILVDPEAALQVFAAPFKSLIAVGLDVTERVFLHRGDWDAVAGKHSLPPSAGLLGEVGRFAFQDLSRDRFALHDPLAVQVSLMPDLVHVEPSEISIDVEGETVGQTRVVGHGQVHVAVDVEHERAASDFRSVVGLPQQTS
ncbi:MAG: nucleoside hydrolase [Thermomicrobiales bacterium]